MVAKDTPPKARLKFCASKKTLRTPIETGGPTSGLASQVERAHRGTAPRKGRSHPGPDPGPISAPVSIRVVQASEPIHGGPARNLLLFLSAGSKGDVVCQSTSP